LRAPTAERSAADDAHCARHDERVLVGARLVDVAEQVEDFRAAVFVVSSWTFEVHVHAS
jgi:hypothetical protein